MTLKVLKLILNIDQKYKYLAFITNGWKSFCIQNSSYYKLSADSDRAPPALSNLQQRPTWSSPSTAQLKQAAVAQTMPTYEMTIHSNAWLKTVITFHSGLTCKHLLLQTRKFACEDNSNNQVLSYLPLSKNIFEINI